ncbi:MAG: hypothetical protein MUF30_08470 [Burkholderiales bacterium]|nr:hypothetical protein [Burkholderiales bacterium]
MYIVAIAWLYVTLLMGLAERSFVSGVLTFVFYGLAPLMLVLWLFGGPRRKRARAAREAVADTAGVSDATAGAVTDAEPAVDDAAGDVAADRVPDAADPERP